MNYKIIKRKVLKQLTSEKLFFVENIFDNEYLGKIIGCAIGYFVLLICWMPCFIISLFQINKISKKIKIDIEKNQNYLKY